MITIDGLSHVDVDADMLPEYATITFIYPKRHNGETTEESLSYTRETDFLSGRGILNDKIFHVLGLDAETTCQEAYGYEPLGGQWPQCRPHDSEALARVIMLLQKKLTMFRKKFPQPIPGRMLTIYD